MSKAEQRVLMVVLAILSGLVILASVACDEPDNTYTTDATPFCIGDCD